jgi:hypothetical protein
MPAVIDYLEGKKVCVVFCQLHNEESFKDGANPEEGNFKLKCLHGLGNIIDDGKYLRVEGPKGSFSVPPSAYNNIHPNDGTDLLEDCDYFVMVKLDHKLEM